MRRLLSILILSILSLHASLAQVTWSEPMVMALGGRDYRISVTATLDSGWHMYALDAPADMVNPTTFRFNSPANYTLLGEVTTTTKPLEESVDLGVVSYDVSYYAESVTFQQDIRLKGLKSAALVDFNVEWMLCNDVSCIPPSDRDFSLLVGESSGADMSVDIDSNFSRESGASGSLWRVILEAMLWGFAALLTPCVFPMVPMTISFFLKGAEGEGRGRVAAAIYGLFIVALYTLPIAAIIFITRWLGGDAVTADIFNWVATHWLPNILFFVIFIIFALSFFGLFEITLPSSWVNKSDNLAGKGSLGGIFFLALTLVLVSFSCTGPIVGSVLIKSAAGEFWQPIITMLFFSAAFALPFVVVALSPSLIKYLPKSGGWLGSVKVVLGFLELALALKFLSVADQIYHWGILSRELYIILWIVIFSLLGLYLLGVLHIGEGRKAGRVGAVRLALAVASFSFVAYISTGLWGAALKPLSGYLPAAKSSEVLYLGSLEQAQRYANSVGKPILLDFTGYGCVNCREMEQRVWSDPRVDEILRNEFVVVPLYMDDKEQLHESEWVYRDGGRVLKSRGRVISHFAKERYGVNSQPTYIPIDRDGNPLTSPRGYDLDVDAYVEFLETALQRYARETE